jgi:5-methylcytosine-specific restriction endonuclease McrA
MAERICIAEGCDRPFRTMGMCNRCYMRDRRLRMPAPPKIERTDAVKAYDRERNRAWCARNAERRKATRNRWRAARPDDHRLQNREYFSRRRADGDKPVRYVDILKQHGMVCHICGDAIAHKSDLHFDHVIPLSRGGLHVTENIKPSHAACNIRKGARLLAG